MPNYCNFLFLLQYEKIKAEMGKYVLHLHLPTYRSRTMQLEANSKSTEVYM